MYVLASKSGILTGKRLARELGLKFHTNASKLRQNSSIFIRYGNAQESVNITNDTECNSRDSIIRCSNKHKLFYYLKNSGLLTPQYFPYSTIMGRTIPEELGAKFLCRKRKHHAGKDIRIVNRGNFISENTEFLVPLYENITREYRVHVVFGKIVKIMRKYPVDENAHSIIKTSSFGWQYRLSKLENIQCAKSMRETALKFGVPFPEFE